MEFRYEKVSQDEVEKFHLNQLWNHYHEGAFIYLPEKWFEHSWTLDRERKVWLYDMNHYHKNWDGDLYLFNYHGINIEMLVKMNKENDSIINIDFISANSQFKIVKRDCDNFLPLEDVSFDKDFDFINKFNINEVKALFKEALTSYLKETPCRQQVNSSNYFLNYNW